MATTQLSEAYGLQKTKSGAVSSPDISEGKKYVSIIDQNSGRYTSGYVEIDASNQLVGSQGWANQGDSYITVPISITAKVLGALPSTLKQSSRFHVMPKTNITNWVDSISVELNGQTIVSEGSYKWRHANIKALLETSESELQKHGDERFLSGGIDDWTSLGYLGAAGPFGDGYYNTRTDDKSATDRTDVQNAPNSICNSAAFQRSIQACPMGVNKTSETTTSPFNWPSLGKGTGTEEILRSNANRPWQEYLTIAAAGDTIGEWFLPLHIHLRDLLDVFDKIPLCQSAQLKIRLKMNCGSFTVGYGSNVLMNLESVNMTSRTIVPIMLNNCLEVAKNSEDAPMVVDTTKIKVAFGVYDNEFTTRKRVGEYLLYNECSLNVPFYQLTPQTESALLSKPVHKVEFEDAFVQLFRDQAGSGTQSTPQNVSFNLMVGGAHKHEKYVAFVPWVNTSTGFRGCG